MSAHLPPEPVAQAETFDHPILEMTAAELLRDHGIDYPQD